MDLSSRPAHIARALTEADLAAQRDGMRGQVAAEFQRLYAYAVANLGDDGDGNPDPRFAELAVRILDRVVKLHRLDSSPVAEQAEESGPGEQTARKMGIVQAQIAALAERAA